MNYQIRIGSKKLRLLAGQGSAQDLLSNTIQEEHQVFCTCKFPNPLMIIDSSEATLKLVAINDASLIQHRPNCSYWSREAKAVSLTLLEEIWMTSQLNIWTPKMTSKRSFRSVKRIIEKAAKCIHYDNESLGENLTIPLMQIEMPAAGLTLGLIKRVYKSHYTLHNVCGKFKIEVDTQEKIWEIRDCLRNKNIKVFCIVNEERDFVDSLVTERNCLPLNTKQLGISLRSTIDNVQRKNRFFVTNNKKVVQF